MHYAQDIQTLLKTLFKVIIHFKRNNNVVKVKKIMLKDHRGQRKLTHFEH